MQLHDNATAFLETLLDTIGFDGDRSAFAKEFVEVSLRLAVAELIEEIDEKDMFLVEKTTTLQELVTRLTDKVGEEKLTERMQLVFARELVEYIKEIAPTLKPDVKNAVLEHFSKLK